jgi:hypothetical protein
MVEVFMKKKKKSKPRTLGYLEEFNLMKKAFKYYSKEMEETTNSFIKKNPNAFNTNFYLFQNMPNKSKLIDTIFELGYFYDKNFVGNKEFMHIPSIKKIADNVSHYPVILATEKNGFSEEIIGATTIKLENNSSILDNPYFPTKNENVLTITGVLAKQNITDTFGNRLRGVGKELFKSSIKGAYKLNKEEKVRIICEIDCRNINSLNAICKAVLDLKQELDINLFLTGYYEIINKEGNLIEAPTFMFEVDLNGDKELDNSQKLFSYENCSYLDLYTDLINVIQENTDEIKEQSSKVDENIVCYHEIKPINALNITLDVADTANGNERVPTLEKAMQVELVQA